MDFIIFAVLKQMHTYNMELESFAHSHKIHQSSPEDNIYVPLMQFFCCAVFDYCWSRQKEFPVNFVFVSDSSPFF